MKSAEEQKWNRPAEDHMKKSKYMMCGSCKKRKKKSMWQDYNGTILTAFISAEAE